MSYFLVDDQMHSHDKTLELVGSAVGRQAIGLWTAAGSWCGGHPETMGAISLKRVRALGFTQKHAETLESVRFWDKTSEGWVFHDWVDHRPNDRKLAKRREDTRNRVRKHRGNQDGNALRESVTGKDGHALPGHTVPFPSVPDRTEPTGNADSLDRFADAWRRITKRSDFSDGCGQYTGTELQTLKDFRRHCDGSVSEFEARVSAQLAADSKGFLLRQTLLHWEAGPIRQRANSVPTTGPLPAQTIDDFDAEATLD